MKRREATGTALEPLPQRFRAYPGEVRCWCAYCCPELSESERERRRAEYDTWRRDRSAWARSHGYTYADLRDAT